MKCPSCKDKTLTITERKGIEIDYCPECRGIWLDRGELDKILERSAREEQESRPVESEVRLSSYGKDHKDYYHSKPYKRKKSLLEELFD